MKYLVVDQKENAAYIDEFMAEKEAIDFADRMWANLSIHDRKKVKAFYVLESVNPDQGAENHLVGDVVKRYDLSKISQGVMDAIATYMEDDIREQIHQELAPCRPEEFLKRYIEIDPKFEDLLKSEFDIEIE